MESVHAPDSIKLAAASCSHLNSKEMLAQGVLLGNIWTTDLLYGADCDFQVYPIFRFVVVQKIYSE